MKENKDYFLIKIDSICKREPWDLYNNTRAGIYRREQTKEYQDFMIEKHEMPSEIIKNLTMRFYCRKCNKIFTASYIELQNTFGYDCFFVCPVCKSILEKNKE
ncbi:MAG TPA: hypothetical protein K8V77_01850 [Brachyspira hyodysenteriae]|nr:hypothetical protein [Brachyspira hyodysenteriae]